MFHENDSIIFLKIFHFFHLSVMLFCCTQSHEHEHKKYETTEEYFQ